MLLLRREIFTSLSLGPFSVWKVYFALTVSLHFCTINSLLSFLASLLSFILTIISVCLIFLAILFIFSLQAVAQLVEALRYKSGDCRFDSRWCNRNFLLT